MSGRSCLKAFALHLELTAVCGAQKFVFKARELFLLCILSDGVCQTCDFSLVWREGDEEVNGTEERIDSIAGNDGLICGLSRPRQKKRKKSVLSN